MHIETKVVSIPCILHVLAIDLPTGNKWDEASFAGDMQYQILTMRKKRALWLERKVTPEIYEELFETACEAYND